MNYPANDTAFEDVTIVQARAEERSGGWSIELSDGWSFFVPKDSPIAPAPGMSARFYGKGIGFGVRGLFLDSREVFYRTEADQKRHEREERYGKNAVDLVRKWDADETIWSITLGGFGPSYEQALHVASVEFAREGLDVPLEGDRETFFRGGWDEVCTHALERIKPWFTGLSGAQYGAAKWLAWQWVHGDGPAFVADPKYDDRTIQVTRRWVPGCAAHAHGVGASDEAQAHDARRYRFLRDAAHPDTNGGLRCVGNCADGGQPLHISGRDLDRAVDAAAAGNVVDPTACPECIGMGCEACNGTGDATTMKAKCDGNHGGPRCADPECWNDDSVGAMSGPASLTELRRLIADDAYAMTFQTFGQYRSALLKAAYTITAHGVIASDESKGGV